MSSAQLHRGEVYVSSLFLGGCLSFPLSGNFLNILWSTAVVPDSPHTIGVEFGTRIIEVMGKKIKLQIWYVLLLWGSLLPQDQELNWLSIVSVLTLILWIGILRDRRGLGLSPEAIIAELLEPCWCMISPGVRLSTTSLPGWLTREILPPQTRLLCWSGTSPI